MLTSSAYSLINHQNHQVEHLFNLLTVTLVAILDEQVVLPPRVPSLYFPQPFVVKPDHLISQYVKPLLQSAQQFVDEVLHQDARHLLGSIRAGQCLCPLEHNLEWLDVLIRWLHIQSLNCIAKLWHNISV